MDEGELHQVNAARGRLHPPDDDLHWLVANTDDLFYRAVLDAGAPSADSWFPARDALLMGDDEARYGVTSEAWTTRVRPDHQADYAQFRRRVLATRAGSHVLRYRFTRRDGATALLRETVSVDTDGAGRQRLRGLIADLTASDEADKIPGENLRALAGPILHRLGNETMLIACNCELALRGVPLDAGRQELFADMKAAVHRAEGLTGWLRSQLRKGTPGVLRFDLRTTLQQTQESLLSGPGDGPLVRIHTPSEPLFVNGSAASLRRAVLILIEAAAHQAQGRGGRIEVRAGAGGVGPTRSLAIIEIRHLPETATDAPAAGAGLRIAPDEAAVPDVALPIARDLLRAMSGDVRLLEPPGGAVVARIELPLVVPS